MEEVLAFLEAFVKEEYETIIALHTEPNDDIFEAKCSRLNNLLVKDLDSELYRSSAKNLESVEKVLRTYQPRILFQVKQYNHPIFHELYQAYMSSTWRGSNHYFTSFFIGKVANSLKVLAQYNICNECNGTGWQDDYHCEECNGFGWNWRGGFKLKELGKLVDVCKFQPPDNPTQITEYKAE